MEGDVTGLAAVGRSSILLIVGVAAIGGLLALHFAGPDIAELVFQSAVADLFCAALWWPLRSQARAWLVFAAVLLAHLLLALILPWLAGYLADPGGIVLLIVDLLAVLGISAMVERRTRPAASRHR